MIRAPDAMGPVHFVGIGGIGMSGIAEVLHNQGYAVQGSDIAESASVNRLRRLGIPVAIGHARDNVGKASVVVVSSAIAADNAEVAEARRTWIPIVRRAEMLGELMRPVMSIAVSGTHGKTTTTSLVGWMLECADLDPTVINGGIVNAYGANTRMGKGGWMVAEADESDGSFLQLPMTAAVVTNMDPEHLESYGSFDAVREAYARFIGNIPFYGFAVLCIDDVDVHSLVGRVTDRRIVTYGLGAQADVRGTRLRLTGTGYRFDAVLTDRRTHVSRSLVDLDLPMWGRHNVTNALAAICVARELGIDDDTVKRALATFAGVRRRFTRIGEARGVTIIDDYAHHPVEIAAVLQAAREVFQGHVIAVVQPHRYTRLASLFDEFCACFNEADAVIVADVYAAGEAPMADASRQRLVEGLRERGHRRVLSLDRPEDLAAMVDRVTVPGDAVICMGAGSITQWAASLPGQLDAFDGDDVREAS
ncbi:MAG: UDP-N-acetylmuramate--L-alanine ligase [bacterium]|nr:UDP-N-acetylmuramate--L-alanine ligase [bacterium]MDE0418216.1 UDP-N-acetylmuramate--L-alanine ligase [bacterium]